MKAISRRRPRDRKIELKPWVGKARDFYFVDYASWKAGQRGKALHNLRFYDALLMWYEGSTMDEIAWDLNMTPGSVQAGLRQCENRVQLYKKTEENRSYETI